MAADRRSFRIFGLGLPMLMVLALTMAAIPPARAQNHVILSQVDWLATYPNGGPYGGPQWAGSSFAVNSANGNIVFSTTWGGSIEMLNPQTGVLTTLGTYSNSGGIALDSNNNLYIDGQYSWVVLKVPFIDGAYVPFSDPAPLGYTPPGLQLPPDCTGNDQSACVVAPLSNLLINIDYSGASTLAFDSQGDLFLATGNTFVTPNQLANAILECSAACLENTANSPQPVLVFQEPAGEFSAAGQLSVGGMAIDPEGNLFFTDVNLVTPTPDTYGNPAATFSDLNELPYTGLGETGYAAAPTVLYTETDPNIYEFNDEIDAVAIAPDGTVYVADQYNGIFAFPDNGGTLTQAYVASSMYTLSTQGFGLLTLDSQGHLYGVEWAWADALGANVVSEIAVNKLAAPGTPVGVAATNSAYWDPIATILNDGGCSSDEIAGFVPSTSEFSAATIGGCVTTLSGGSAYPTAVTFTPAAVGIRTAMLTATDSAGNSGTAAVSGFGEYALSWATPAPITYGTALSATQLDATATVAGTFVYTPAAGTVLGAGTQTLSVTFTPANTSYASVTTTVNLAVNQATPTVVSLPVAGPIGYGETLASSTLTGGAAISPLTNASVPGTFSFTASAATPSAGTQSESVTFTPTDSTDYASAGGMVNVMVSPAALTVAASPLSLTYGQYSGATHLSYTVSGFELGQTAQTDLTGSPLETTNAPLNGAVGAYTIAISQGTLALKPPYNQDYTLIFQSAPLAISPATLTVTATNQTDVYGAVDPDRCGNVNKHLAYTITGFAYGQNQTMVLSGAPSETTTATPKSNVGVYPITITRGTLAIQTPYAQDYTLAFVNGTLTVTPAPLWVVAKSYARPIHTPNPPFSYTISGFVNGDTQATALTGAPACCSTAATISSQAGDYAIVIGPGTLAAVDGNYALRYVDGVLIVYNPRDPFDPHCNGQGGYANNFAWDQTHWPDPSSFNYYWGGGGGLSIIPWGD